jgi:transposase
VKHVAIDLGGRESQVCVRAADGSILREAKVATRTLPKLLAAMPEPARVIVETSAEAFRIADAALAAKHEVRVVPATLVKQLGVGSRNVKTDRKDARVLSEVSCRIELPSVHIPTARSRSLKSQCGAREALIRCRTLLINNVRGWMRTQLIRLATGGTAAFTERLRTHAETHKLELPDHVTSLLTAIDSLNVQVKAADKALKQLAEADSVCRLLMTVPGVGPVTAVRFVAAIDDVKRFKNAHALQSYLGLTPGENSSSDRNQRLGITKAGSSELRRALVQGAWVVMYRAKREPMAAWAERIALRRGKFIAVVALARKLAGILFALWRDETTYRSVKSAAKSEEVAVAA